MTDSLKSAPHIIFLVACFWNREKVPKLPLWPGWAAEKIFSVNIFFRVKNRMGVYLLSKALPMPSPTHINTGRWAQLFLCRHALSCCVFSTDPFDGNQIFVEHFRNIYLILYKSSFQNIFKKLFVPIMQLGRQISKSEHEHKQEDWAMAYTLRTPTWIQYTASVISNILIF